MPHSVPRINDLQSLLSMEQQFEKIAFKERISSFSKEELMDFCLRLYTEKSLFRKLYENML